MESHQTKAILEKAQSLANALNMSSTRRGKGDRAFVVKGVDKNEVKKIYTFFCKHNDLIKLRELINLLPQSPLCRTQMTSGCYRNIQSAFNSERIFNLSVDEAKAVIGWACRLL